MATFNDLTDQEKAEINSTTRRLGTQGVFNPHSASDSAQEPVTRYHSDDLIRYNPYDNKYSRHRYISTSRKASSATGSVLSAFLFWPFRLFKIMPVWAKFVGFIWCLMAGFGLFWTVIVYYHGMTIHHPTDAIAQTVVMAIASLLFPAIFLGVLTLFGLLVRGIINLYLNR